MIDAAMDEFGRLNAKIVSLTRERDGHIAEIGQRVEEVRQLNELVERYSFKSNGLMAERNCLLEKVAQARTEIAEQALLYRGAMAEIDHLQCRVVELEGREAKWREAIEAADRRATVAEGVVDQAETEAAEQRKRAQEAEACVAELEVQNAIDAEADEILLAVAAGRRTLRHVKPFQWEAERLCHGETPANWRCDACGAPLCDLHAAPGPLEHGCPTRPAGQNSGFSLWPAVGFDVAAAIEKARQEERENAAKEWAQERRDRLEVVEAARRNERERIVRWLRARDGALDDGWGGYYGDALDDDAAKPAALKSTKEPTHVPAAVVTDAIEKARQEALEAAARVADSWGKRHVAQHIANQIRALKSAKDVPEGVDGGVT